MKTAQEASYYCIYHNYALELTSVLGAEAALHLPEQGGEKESYNYLLCIKTIVLSYNYNY